MNQPMDTRIDLNGDELPTAYSVVEVGGRFYPLRFGRFRLDARDFRISYGRREDAILFCFREQRDYERQTSR